MPVPLASESLILFPHDWRRESGAPDLLAELIDSTCLGTAGADGFSEGKRFGEHIAFMGCAPAVRNHEAVASGSKPDSRIKIQTASVHPYFYFLSGRLNPRCPGCRRRIPGDAIRGISLPCSTEIEVSCPGCREICMFGDLGWKQSAGLARTAILIADIFPFEAIPQQSFLKALEKVGTGPWGYCYADTRFECNNDMAD